MVIIIVNDCYSEWSAHGPPHPSVPHAKLLQAFSRILYCKLPEMRAVAWERGKVCEVIDIQLMVMATT